MQKQTHPYKIKSKLQLKDGAIYLKKWLYFREDLSLDVDQTINERWQNNILISPETFHYKSTKK